MVVRIISEQVSARIESTDFVRVETHVAPDDDTLTLATIQRIVDKNAGRETAEPLWRVKTLVLETPMSPEQAVGFATRYAERKGIPVVLAGNK
jgi:hypothetical protein